MRRFALVLASAIAFAFLGSQASAQAPTAVVASSWTGLYVGGHAGAAWMDSFNAQFSGQVAPANPFIPTSLSESGLGAVGGAHLGYNWQFHSNWLVGVEGDWSWASLSGGNTSAPTSIFAAGFGAIPLISSQTSAHADVRSLASVRGRFGYVGSNWLIYGTGGLAWADVDYNGSFGCTPAIPVGTQAACSVAVGAQSSASKINSGWVAGGGIEYKAASTPWIFGLEYLYYTFDDALTLAAPIQVLPPANAAVAVWAFNDLDIQVVRVRLTYKVF
jgi:outer membrane immunogenic protein